MAAAELGVTPEDVDRLAGCYDPSSERLYPGVPEVLAALQPSYRLGVIANQSVGTIARLQSFGIHDAFEVIVASAEVGLSKPDPRIFDHALSLAKCTPESATMVGDRLDNDIGPANRAGWHTVRVLQGFSRTQSPRSETEKPDETVESIRELPDLLARRQAVQG